MTAPYRKKLIEVALPLDAVNREASKEKAIRHGHPSTLHLWWARRPLATARASLFAQLVDDPSSRPEEFPTPEAQENERRRLFAILEALVAWENSNQSELLASARKEIALSWARSHPSALGKRIERGEATTTEIERFCLEEMPPVHDPFSGGGSIPLEAGRLGLRAVATDLNPVAVVIARAALEIPALFWTSPPVNPDSRTNLVGWSGLSGLAADVRHYGAVVRDAAGRQLRQYYEGRNGEQLVAWIWARTVPSPDPSFNDAEVPLVSTYWLCSDTRDPWWLSPVVDAQNKTWQFEVRSGAPDSPKDVDAGTKSGHGANFKCLLSGTPISGAYIKQKGKEGALRERLIAVVATHGRKRMFRAVDQFDRARADPPVAEWQPDFPLPNHSQYVGTLSYGIVNFRQLFTKRQLFTLDIFCKSIIATRDKVVADAVAAGMPRGDRLAQRVQSADAYADAVTVHLAFALSKMLDTNTSLCTWQNKPPRLRSTFGRQAFPMTWDFAEANPFGEGAGDYERCIDTQVRVIENEPLCRAARAYQADATEMHREQPAIICTDPPYYDNVPYADLSDFFYVWLRRILADIYPDIFTTVLTPKAAELVADRVRHGGADAAERFFLDGMGAAIREMARALPEGETASIFYAFKQREQTTSGTASTGWETFLTGIHEAGFQVVGTWPMRTEWSTRMRSNEANALATSVVLALRRRTGSSATSRTDLRRELKADLSGSLRILRAQNIAPVDIAQAAIGPGMAVFTKYARVLESDGSAMTVGSAIKLINELLDEQLEHEGAYDSDTRFAVTWYETHAFGAGAYGEAETLAKARAVAVEGIAEAGILKSGGGKVRLLKRTELPSDWDPRTDKRLTVWEATQHLIKRLEEAGEEAAAALLHALGALGDPARDLAYRLYSACDRKGWADEARAYNGLVAAWPDLERLAAAAASAPAQQNLL